MIDVIQTCRDCGTKTLVTNRDGLCWQCCTNTDKPLPGLTCPRCGRSVTALIGGACGRCWQPHQVNRCQCTKCFCTVVPDFHDRLCADCMLGDHGDPRQGSAA